MRQFDSGATRDTDEGKPDYEGYLSPLVIERFGQYMLKHSKQANGEIRPSDNWQKGIPLTAYMKSGWRHFFDWWSLHRMSEECLEYGDVFGLEEDLEEAICALIFNAQGYLHEHLKSK